MKKVLIVIAPENFQHKEYGKPKEILENAGYVVETASEEVKVAHAMNGFKAHIDLNITEVEPDQYLGVIFAGGTGAKVYFEDPEVHKIIQEFNNQNKLIGAICIAPSILVNAGVLEGRKATSFPSQENHLRNNGVNFVEEDVVKDGNFITANGPEAAEEFGKQFLKVLE